MIKKVIGVIVALAAIVVIVIATMHSDKFKSLVFDEGEPASAVEAAANVDAQQPEADSTAVVHPDSMVVPKH